MYKIELFIKNLIVGDFKVLICVQCCHFIIKRYSQIFLKWFCLIKNS